MFAKFRREKYDFDLDFSWKKMTQIPMLCFRYDFNLYSTIWFRPLQRIFHGKMAQFRQILNLYFKIARFLQ
jgi:hypothetical protein